MDRAPGRQADVLVKVWAAGAALRAGCAAFQAAFPAAAASVRQASAAGPRREERGHFTWLSRPGARCRDCSRSASQAARRTRGASLDATGSPRCLPLGVVVHSQRGWGSCSRGTGATRYLRLVHVPEQPRGEDFASALANRSEICPSSRGAL